MNELKVLSETENWLIVSKPSGLIVERSERFNSLEEQVFSYLKQQKKKPFVGVVHRLDRPTSGAIIFAKKKSVLKKLNELISYRKIIKNYSAILESEPPQQKGTLTHWLEKSNIQKKAIVHSKPGEKYKQAILKYESAGECELGFLVKIKLSTGRYHQIRAQFSAIGCPVVGDEKYGSNKLFEPNSICLHSRELIFTDPFSGKKILAEAPLPGKWKI